MLPEDAKKYLADWEPCLIIVDDPFVGKHSVPGWKCKKCGAQYGCVVPPEKCWLCPTNQNEGDDEEDWPCVEDPFCMEAS